MPNRQRKRVNETARRTGFETLSTAELVYLLSLRSQDDQETFPILPTSSKELLVKASLESWEGDLIAPTSAALLRFEHIRYPNPADAFLERSERNQYEEMHPSSYWENPVFRQLILGTACSTSPLHVFYGNADVLTLIFSLVYSSWERHIRMFASLTSECPGPRAFYPLRYSVAFPPPSGIQINMMPFILGDLNSLPKMYHGYGPFLNACAQPRDDVGTPKIGYLTIDESFVRANKTQRRPGLHIDSTKEVTKSGEGQVTIIHHPWGGGVADSATISGGIYLCSNVDDTCAVYPAIIDHPEQVMGNHGDLEHLRGMVGTPFVLKANRLVWISDCTPHEGLPMKQDEYRQFFRLVVGNVSVWFAEHNTPNPLGIQPSARIVHGNKFKL